MDSLADLGVDPTPSYRAMRHLLGSHCYLYPFHSCEVLEDSQEHARKNGEEPEKDYGTRKEKEQVFEQDVEYTLEILWLK